MTDRNEAFEDYMTRAYGIYWDKLSSTLIATAQAAFYAGHDAAVGLAVARVR